MSITDELRRVAAKTECANGRCEKLYRGDLDHIADRIDAEHERLCSRSRSNGYGDGFTDGFNDIESWIVDHEDAMAEHGWVRLPKDADGEYIHAGEKLDGYGKTITVVEMRYGRSGWVLISEYGNAYADSYAFTHHYAPTVEDVLREFAEGLGVPVADSYIAASAAKLRLRGDAE